MFLKLIDTVTGTMVTQMEFAGRRMEEIGLTGKASGRVGVWMLGCVGVWVYGRMTSGCVGVWVYDAWVCEYGCVGV